MKMTQEADEIYLMLIESRKYINKALEKGAYDGIVDGGHGVRKLVEKIDRVETIVKIHRDATVEEINARTKELKEETAMLDKARAKINTFTEDLLAKKARGGVLLDSENDFLKLQDDIFKNGK